jgi:flavin reductase (DIM6/NTAB) family NADH-FMN oxidoreductase RutF
MKKAIGPQTLLYPMPAVLVGTQVQGKPNFMTAAWCGIAASTPPAISVAIRPARFTFEGISENNTFSINIPSADMAEKVDHCGIYSGHKVDKSQIFEVAYGKLNTAPLI